MHFVMIMLSNFFFFFCIVGNYTRHLHTLCQWKNQLYYYNYLMIISIRLAVKSINFCLLWYQKKARDWRIFIQQKLAISQQTSKSWVFCNWLLFFYKCFILYWPALISLLRIYSWYQNFENKVLLENLKRSCCQWTNFKPSWLDK